MGGRPTGLSAAAGGWTRRAAGYPPPRLSADAPTTLSKTGDGAPVGEQLPDRGVVRADIRCQRPRPIRGRAVKLMLDSDA